MPVGLTDADVWDWLDSATMVGLASWFAQSSDTGGPMFNWSSELDGDSFALYLSNKSSPSNPPTLPTATAPTHPGPSSPPCPPSPSPPPGYIHSYHVDLLLADSKDLARRSGTSAATDTLAPHPLLTSTQISSAITIDKKTFLSADLPMLTSSTPSSIHSWYQKLCQQATATQIDLCPHHHFVKGHARPLAPQSPCSHCF